MICALIQDLCGVYKDGCASRQTKKIIEDHLKSCEVCRGFYRDAPVHTGYVCAPHHGDYQLLAKRIRRQKTATVAVSSLAMLAAVLVIERVRSKK